MDGKFLLRTSLEEVAKDTAQEQQKQAGRHHPHKESLMVPEQRKSIKQQHGTPDLKE